MAKIDAKNEVLDQFTDSLQLDPDMVDNLDMYSHIPPSLMEKCAALSVRPDTVKSLVQSMQGLSGVFTDVEASLKDIKDILDEEEKEEKKLQEEVGKANAVQTSAPAVAEVSKEWTKYMEVHEKASFTNTELHKAMNQHIGNLRLLSGPLEQLQQALPTPTLTEDDRSVLQNLKKILGKVQEMREQRVSLEQQLRDTIQKDDITTSLVTTDRSEMKKLFAEQLKKYEQLKVYIDQNLSAQENILKALTDANVKYAPIRKVLTESEQKWNHTVQTLISSYEAYEDLMKKCQEGRDFYADLEGKVGKLLEKGRAAQEASQAHRLQILEREMKKKPPPRPTAPKPALEKKVSDTDLENIPAADLADMQQFSSLFLSDLPEELRSLPPDALLAHFNLLSADARGGFPVDPLSAYGGIGMPGADAYRAGRTATAPMPDSQAVPFNQAPYNAAPGQMPHMAAGAGHGFPPVSYGNIPPVSSGTAVPPQMMHPSVSQPSGTGQVPTSSTSPSPNVYSAGGPSRPAPMAPGYMGATMPPQRTSPQHLPMSVSGGAPLANQYKPVSAVGFGMGQAPSVVSGPMNPSVPNPSLASNMRPQATPGIRPATTTVDSIQGPISSYAAPRMPSVPLLPSHSPSGYMGAHIHPAMGPSHPFTYSQGGLPNYAQPPAHVAHAQPNQMFHIPGQPHPLPGQPPYGQHQFTPQMRAPLHPQPPAVYQPGQPARVPLVNPMLPQQQYPQYAVPPQHPAVQQQHPTVPPQHPSVPPPPHLMPLRYPLPHQDKPASPLLHTTYPGAMPRASPQPIQSVPLPMSQPSPQILPHASVPGSGAAMPFAPPARHPIPPSNTIVNSMPPGPPMAMGAPQAPPLAHHAQPPGSPALSQLPGGAIVSGAPAIPSPAPSPQPSLVVQPPAPVSTSAAIPPRPPPSLTPGTTPLSQASTESVFHRQSSTTDDLLSSSPESQHGGSKTSVGQPLLQPTKADSKDGLKPKGIQLIENDPYEKPEHVMRLLAELDRFRLVVATLDKPVPGAATQLDAMWKEFQDAQEKEARNLSIAIARCYTMKNRHQDIMPYDKNRIVLQSGKDDYINASKIEDLSPYCPTIIATQAPLPGTASDFWLMIYEQKVSLIVMLVSDLEIEKQKVVRYFPPERGQPLLHGHITLTLTSLKVTDTHVERVISLQYKDQSLKRSIIHLQFTSWPELGLPDSKGNLLRFIQDVHKHYLHQRPLHMPIVVHCSSGVGRSGAFSLLYAAVQEVEAGNGIPELAELVKKMRQQRKHMLQEKIHLKFCYEAVLKHAEQVLQRHGFYTPTASKPQPSASQKIYALQDPQDIVLGGDMPISSIQATIAKLSIKPCAGGLESANHYPPPLDMSEPPPAEMAQPVFPPSSSLPDLTASLLIEPQTPPILTTTINGTSEAPAETTNSHEPTPAPDPASAAPTPSSSSLNLLASLTPETFNLDSCQRGKQKMNKQSFLQPQNGSGLVRGGAKAGDDPLNMLDPLWTLNKT